VRTSPTTDAPLPRLPQQLPHLPRAPRHHGSEKSAADASCAGRATP